MGCEAATSLVSAVRAACPPESVVLKVIIESGELDTEPLIAAATRAAIAGGCDFAKTSTGKVKVNATPEAAKVMLGTIAAQTKRRANGQSIGFKVAGGVKDAKAAQVYLELAAEAFFGDRRSLQRVDSNLLRFGASSLLPALRTCCGSAGGKKRALDVDSEEALAQQAVSLIDHTSLGLDDTEDKIRALADAAVAEAPHTAALCVYPKFVKMLREMQAKQPDRYPRSLRICTVVNFPSGQEALEKVVSDTKTAVAAGADEVDVVIDYKLLQRDEAMGCEAATSLVSAVRAACPPESVVLKVIIESGELATEPLIAAATRAAIAGGCDFVKTSTGKVKVNATPEAAKLMLSTT